MSEQIWSEDFIAKHPKLAAQAISFLQELLKTQEDDSAMEIDELKGRIDGLTLELALLKEKQ